MAVTKLIFILCMASQLHRTESVTSSVEFSNSHVSGGEGEATALLSKTSPAVTQQGFRVGLQYHDETADGPPDYTPIAAAEIPTNTSFFAVQIQLKQDSLVEQDETFLVTIRSVLPNYINDDSVTLGDHTTATVTIEDDDPVYRWSDVVYGCIRGNNGIDDVEATFEDCQQRCEDESSFVCLSVDYRSDNGQCSLNRANSYSVYPASDYTQPCYTESDVYYYAERIGEVHHQECGFAYNEYDGAINFQATNEGNCSLTIFSSMTKLVVFTLQSYSLFWSGDGDYGNEMEVLGDDQLLGKYCGYSKSQQSHAVYARAVEFRVATGNGSRDSRLEVKFYKIESSTMCNFDDSLGCGLQHDRTSWARHNRLCAGFKTAWDSFWESYSYSSLQLLSGSGQEWSKHGYFYRSTYPAPFELGVPSSHNLVMFFRYAFTRCEDLDSDNELRIEVLYCRRNTTISRRVEDIMEGRHLSNLPCDDSWGWMEISAESQPGYTVSLDDILVWNLDGSSAPITVLSEYHPTDDSECKKKDVTTPVTVLSEYHPTDNSGFKDKVSHAVYIIPVVCAILLAFAAVGGIVVFRRRNQGATETTGLEKVVPLEWITK